MYKRWRGHDKNQVVAKEVAAGRFKLGTLRPPGSCPATIPLPESICVELLGHPLLSFVHVPCTLCVAIPPPAHKVCLVCAVGGVEVSYGWGPPSFYRVPTLTLGNTHVEQWSPPIIPPNVKGKAMSFRCAVENGTISHKEHSNRKKLFLSRTLRRRSRNWCNCFWFLGDNPEGPQSLKV